MNCCLHKYLDPKILEMFYSCDRREVPCVTIHATLASLAPSLRPSLPPIDMTFAAVIFSLTLRPIPPQHETALQRFPFPSLPPFPFPE